MNNRLSFGILQASRLGMTKTKYISCPSCARILFDPQEITPRIRKRTEHLKCVKIDIMGCSSTTLLRAIYPNGMAPGKPFTDD